MTAAATPPPSRSPLPLVLAAALLALAGAVVWLGFEVAALRTAATKASDTVDRVYAEVTRMRLEQNATGKGAQALLEKLHTFAPLVASARTTQPDFENAKKEIQAIQRAFTSLGADAQRPVLDRIAQLKPENDFEELKWLLDIYVGIDRVAGLKMLEQVLLGYQLPHARLRWHAANALLAADRELAQITLRRVLTTESSRGVDINRLAAYPGATVPDKAAFATQGFNNFVIAYARSEDPQLEDTLLMVIGRTQDDKITVQECVKILGARGCKKAVPVIEKLYREPPLQQEDPIFLNYCLEALVDIQGAEAQPFLQAALPKAASETVTKRIEFLLNKIASGNAVPKTPPAAKDRSSPPGNGK